MRKALFLAVIVALMVCGAAIAADKIGTMGAPNASGQYPIEVFDDRSVVVASDATITIANDLVVTDDALVSGDLSVTGNIVDASIYTKAAGSYPTRIAAIGADGNIYGTGNGIQTNTVFVDGSIYMTTASPASAAGVGLWISQPDGGCSKCYVDAAGTTWACANATCPTNM